MTNIEEINGLMIELMDHEKGAGKEFDERAIEIINEIADYAEKTKLYKDSLQRNDRGYCDKMSAEEMWHHILLKAVGAPTMIHLLSVPIILIPMLRTKLREEGKAE